MISALKVMQGFFQQLQGPLHDDAAGFRAIGRLLVLEGILRSSCSFISKILDVRVGSVGVSGSAFALYKPCSPGILL